MATGAPGTNGVYQYGEDDSEATFSALLNKVASTADTSIGADRARLTTLELSGRILQTNFTTSTTVITTTSAAWQDGSLSVSITPRYNTSKILVFVSESMENINGGQMVLATIFRGTVAAGVNLGSGLDGIISAYSSAGGIIASGSCFVMDSPATTSATTYTVAFRAGGGTAKLGLNLQRRTITALEVKQ